MPLMLLPLAGDIILGKDKNCKRVFPLWTRSNRIERHASHQRCIPEWHHLHPIHEIHACNSFQPCLVAVTLVKISRTCWQKFHSKFILYRWKRGFFVGICKKRLMLFALTEVRIGRYDNSAFHTYALWLYLMPPKLLLITNQTKLTLTIALTLTDTVTIIFLRAFRWHPQNSCIVIIKEIFAEAR